MLIVSTCVVQRREPRIRRLAIHVRAERQQQHRSRKVATPRAMIEQRQAVSVCKICADHCLAAALEVGEPVASQQVAKQRGGAKLRGVEHELCMRFRW